ncbi:class I SAM-dependent methyltransferase, partial [Streptomyces sp. NRRL S-15]|uniref:class I SAM-dependent methyltransferase n=1 Tax=Streptomyces sp. NRRL S-15 TaxID=1463886 RepID=UPI001F4700E8
MVRTGRGRWLLGPGPGRARPRSRTRRPDVPPRLGQTAAGQADGRGPRRPGPAPPARRGHRRGRAARRRRRAPRPVRRGIHPHGRGGGPMSTLLPPATPGPAPWAADPYARALSQGRGPLFLRRDDGWLLPLDVERWCADADAADLSALHRAEGPVLDIGCGPGRLVAALAARGHRALGIDVSEAAVGHTQRIGGSALRRSVFEPLPGEGRWGTA